MTFSHNGFYGNHWEQAADFIERRIRLQRHDASEEPDPECPEAELDDNERRAAMARERMRRLGIR